MTVFQALQFVLTFDKQSAEYIAAVKILLENTFDEDQDAKWLLHTTSEDYEYRRSDETSQKLTDDLIKKLPNLFTSPPDSAEFQELIFAFEYLAKQQQLDDIVISYLNKRLASADKKQHEINFTIIAILLSLNKINEKTLQLFFSAENMPIDMLPELLKHSCSLLKEYLHHYDATIRTRASRICADFTIPLPLDKMLQFTVEGLQNIKSDKDCVLVIGATGSGKSTLINYLTGIQLEKIYNENTGQSLVIPRRGQTHLPQANIGHSTVSKTLYPQALEGEHFTFLDCAGFSDTREGDASICAALNIPFIIQYTKKIRAIIIAMPYELVNFTSGSRGRYFSQLARQLASIIDFQQLLTDAVVYKKSIPIVFAITKIPDPVRGRKFDPTSVKTWFYNGINGLIDSIKGKGEYIRELEEQLKHEIYRLSTASSDTPSENENSKTSINARIQSKKDEIEYIKSESQFLSLLQHLSKQVFIIRGFEEANCQDNPDDKNNLLACLHQLKESNVELSRKYFIFNSKLPDFQKVQSWVDNIAYQFLPILRGIEEIKEKIEEQERQIVAVEKHNIASTHAHDIDTVTAKLKKINSLKEELLLKISALKSNTTLTEYGSEFKPEINSSIIKTILGKFIGMKNYWYFSFEGLPIKYVEMSAVKDNQSRLTFVTDFEKKESTPPYLECNANLPSHHALGHPQIKIVSIDGMKEVGFNQSGEFSLEHYDLEKGQLRITYSCDSEKMGAAGVRIFVSACDLPQNQLLIQEYQSRVDKLDAEMVSLKHKLKCLQESDTKIQISAEDLKRQIIADLLNDKIVMQHCLNKLIHIYHKNVTVFHSFQEIVNLLKLNNNVLLKNFIDLYANLQTSTVKEIKGDLNSKQVAEMECRLTEYTYRFPERKLHQKIKQEQIYSSRNTYALSYLSNPSPGSQHSAVEGAHQSTLNYR